MEVLAAEDVRAQHHGPDGIAGAGDAKCQRVAGAEVPDFNRINAMPARALALAQHIVDVRQADATAGVRIAIGLAVPAAFRVRLEAKALFYCIGRP